MNERRKGDFYGDYPIHNTAHLNKNIIYILLEKSADVNARDDMAQSALHIASQTNKESMINILIRRGAKRSPSCCLGHYTMPFSFLKSKKCNCDQCVITMVKEFFKLTFKGFTFAKKKI